jgi:SAM-dependent methyltransferase
MERIIEPELMEDPEQGQAYARADFSGPNEQFLNLFIKRFPDFEGKGQVLDLGCGPADILIRFARRWPQCDFIGIDGAAAMLAPGLEAVKLENLDDRIDLRCKCLPLAREGSAFQAIISNSLLHHLHQPQVLWQTIESCADHNSLILIMDLFRPGSKKLARDIVQTYAGSESPVLQQDFYNSLLAAFRVNEVRDQLLEAGLALKCEQVSDRHLLVWGKLIG